jgi:hypothetical protein
MKTTTTLKDFDFAIQITLLTLWAGSMLWPLRHGLQSLPWTFPGLAFVAWLLVDAWWRWRREIEDERVRHIILMSGYMSRQLTLAGALLMLLISERHPVGPMAWPLLIAALLLLPDMALRRYFGLQDEELDENRPRWHRSMRRVLAASAIGFLLLAVVALRYILTRHP